MCLHPYCSAPISVFVCVCVCVCVGRGGVVFLFSSRSSNVCVCVCVCARACVCSCVRACARANAPVYACAYVCSYAYVCVRVSACVEELVYSQTRNCLEFAPCGYAEPSSASICSDPSSNARQLNDPVNRLYMHSLPLRAVADHARTEHAIDWAVLHL